MAVAETRATFSTAFSTTEARVASSSSAPSIDVQALFFQPLQALFGEMNVRKLGELSELRWRMAGRYLRSVSADLAVSLNEVSTAEDFREVIEGLAGEKVMMAQKGFELVGFPEMIQLLRDLQASWADMQGQAQPRLPFQQINAAEEHLSRARRELVDANHTQSVAQGAADEAKKEREDLTSDRAAIDARIAEYKARLTELEAAREVLSGRIVELGMKEQSALQVIEESSLVALVADGQVKELTEQLVSLRSSTVGPSPAMLQSLSDFQGLVPDVREALVEFFSSLAG